MKDSSPPLHFQRFLYLVMFILVNFRGIISTFISTFQAYFAGFLSSFQFQPFFIFTMKDFRAFVLCFFVFASFWRILVPSFRFNTFCILSYSLWWISEASFQLGKHFLTDFWSEPSVSILFFIFIWWFSEDLFQRFFWALLEGVLASLVSLSDSQRPCLSFSKLVPNDFNSWFHCKKFGHFLIHSGDFPPSFFMLVLIDANLAKAVQ